MKKETLFEIILGTIGGLTFGIGMSIVLVPEWNMLKPGIITSLIGFIILLCIIPVYKKHHPKKEPAKINWSIVFVWFIGIIGSLILGFGMSKVMVGNPSSQELIIGIIIGVIGLIICVLNYPIYAYLKDNK